jgi:hypothetical protein
MARRVQLVSEKNSKNIIFKNTKPTLLVDKKDNKLNYDFPI